MQTRSSVAAGEGSPITILVVPVQRVVLDFGSCGSKFPSEFELGPLHQVAGDFDVADVGRVLLRVDVVVLEDALGVEVIHESVVLEMLGHALDLRDVEGGLDVGVA